MLDTLLHVPITILLRNRTRKANTKKKVHTSAVSVVSREVALTFVPAAVTRSISVSHRCVVRRAVCNDADITCIKLLTTGAVSH